MAYIHIKTLSPLHIGSGRELQGNFEYLFFNKDRRISLIQEEKVLAVIGKEQISQWLGIIERSGSLLQYLKQRSPKLQPADVAKRVMLVEGQGPGKNQQIEEQLHNGQGYAMLPGSSIKGAIRTAIFTQELTKNPKLARAEIKERRGNRILFKDKQVTSALLGRNPNQDIFRLLRPGDVVFSHTEVFKTLTLNKRRDGWEFDERISPFLECIPADLSAISKITQPESLLAYISKHRSVNPFKQASNLLGWDVLFKSINDHTRKLLEDELDFWRGESKPALAGSYVEEIQKLIEETKKCDPKSCIMRIGYGAGVQFMTGGWQKDLMTSEDYGHWASSFPRSAPQLAFAKTRKLAHDSRPLGFVKLEILSSSQKIEVEKTIQQEWKTAEKKLASVYIPEPVKPQYPPDGQRLRVGSILDAYVFTKPNGKQKKIRIYVGKGQDVDMQIPYPADAILGKIILVSISEMKEGKITNVRFKGLKKENR